MNKFEDYNLNLPFHEYLKLDGLSYSVLKNVNDLGNLFYTGFDDEDPDKEHKGRDLGSVVDDIITNNKSITDNYIITEFESPTSNSLLLAKGILKYIRDNNLSFSQPGFSCTLDVRPHLNHSRGLLIGASVSVGL